MKKHFTIGLLVFFLTGLAAALQAQVSGTVRDTRGEALIGATVSVKGQNLGTVTNIDGKFTIAAPADAILVVSYTGFTTIEIPVEGKTNIDIVLSESTAVLEQVVVVGYGTLTKKQVTGAIAQVRGDDVKKQPLLTPIQGVQGLAAGIQVIGNGEPGRQPRVQIRGVNTILSSTEPLYVVDGVLTDNITNINGADVLSIDILKDGAAAIYGTRAANGVILITTKKGREGKPTLSFDSYRGFRKLINIVEMANAQLYARYTNEARNYDGQPPLFPDLLKLKYNTNWFKEISQNGLVENHNMTVSGATKNFNYLFSAGYFGDEGVLRGAEFHRLTLRSNNEFSPFSFLKIGNALTGTFNNGQPKSAGVFTDAYRIGSTAPVRDSLGRYGFVSGLSVANPVASLELTNDYVNGDRYQGSLYGEAQILDGLTLRTSWGFDRRGLNETSFTPLYSYGIYNNTETKLRLKSLNRFYWVWDKTLRYAKTVAENHQVDIMLGHSAERDRERGQEVRAAKVPAQRNLWYIQQGDPKTVVYTDFAPIALRRESFFGRLNYGFMGKYNLSATLRRDGSSAFPDGQKWGTFYSIGAAWILSEESFLKDISTLDFLKLRGGYAVLGNDNISLITNNLGQLNAITNTDPYGLPGGIVPGITIDQIKDAAATWEETKSYDLGIEFGFINKITGEISYYNKLTGAYLQVKTPSAVDPDGVFTTAADVRNRGVELNIKWSDYFRDNFSYHIGFNATFNKNKVEKIRGQSDRSDGSLGNGEVTTRIVEGEEIGSFWVYQTDGIFQNTAEIDAAPHFTGTLPGDFRYKDINGDGVLDTRDRVIVGSYQPKVYFGVNGGLMWKNFDFSIDCYGNLGNKVYNGKKGVRFGNDNIEASRASRWRDFAPNTNEPRASNSIPKPSTYFVESGDFFRINNITLGYAFQADFLKRAQISRARIFATAQNPVIAKKFSGFTPELPGSSALNNGIELYVYPSVATYMLGFNLNFN